MVLFGQLGVAGTSVLQVALLVLPERVVWAPDRALLSVVGQEDPRAQEE